MYKLQQVEPTKALGQENIIFRKCLCKDVAVRREL